MMKVSITKRRFIVVETILTIIAGIGIGLVIKYGFPGHYFKWYPAIPIYFYFFEWYYITMFDMYRRRNPKKKFSIYMGMKVVKMLVSMLLILLYILLIKVHQEEFILTFFLFYLFSIAYETCFFCMFEINLKNKKYNQDKP